MGKDLQGIWTYKGKKYFCQGEVKMKHPVTRKWVAAVHYVSWGAGYKDYVREKKEFLEKFEFCIPMEADV